MNVLRVLMKLPVMDRLLDCEEPWYKKLYETEVFASEEVYQSCAHIKVGKNAEIPAELIAVEARSKSKLKLEFAERGCYQLEITLRSNHYSELSQMSTSIFGNGALIATINLRGTDVEWKRTVLDLGMIEAGSMNMEMFFGQSGLEVKSCIIVRKK